MWARRLAIDWARIRRSSNALWGLIWPGDWFPVY